MGLRRCCVPGCEDKKSIRRKFPIYDEEVYNVWLERIGNIELYEMDPEKLGKKKFICNLHFSQHCLREGSPRLMYQSLPTIGVPGFQGEPNLYNSLFPYFSGRVPLPKTTLEKTCNAPPLQATLSDLSNKLLLEAEQQPSTSSQGDNNVAVRGKAIEGVNKKQVPKKRSILKAANVHNCHQLNPQSLNLYKEIRTLQKRECYLRKKSLKFKERVEKYQYWLNHHQHDILTGMNKFAYGFINSQIRNYSRKKSARRFTTNEKVFALTLLKSSPRCYNILRKIFVLPSKTIMLKTLRQFRFKTGINDNIFQALAARTKKMTKNDRYCVLMFDEMHLSPNVSYSASDDCFVGFEDFGIQCRKKIADHVLVLMVRGLRTKWKQPLAYYFVHRTIPSAQLLVIIKDVVRKCRSIGLTIVATISDQGSTNRGAITLLIEETKRLCFKQGIENKYLGYVIDNEEVLHIFDPPHLLKCLRNIFLENDVCFTWRGEQKTGRWQDIVKFYEHDGGNDDVRLAPKLTDRHVYKEKMNKMKVSLAAQVFSQRLSAIMRKFAGHNIPGVMELEKNAADTADFLLFVDKVFDSVNGTTVSFNGGKSLRCAISNTSEHISFWHEAINVFLSMKFVNSSTKKVIPIPPTIKNWIHTLKVLEYIWSTLNQAGFRFLSLRNLNQDPLENFFGCIRAHGYRDVNPTCSKFIFLFKTSLLNNTMNNHSKFANCEEDDSVAILNTFQCFLTDGENDTHEVPEVQVVISVGDENTVSQATKAYIAGYVAKKVLQYTKNCNVCKSELVAEDRQDIHSIIEVRSYTAKSLCYPTTYFAALFQDLLHIIADCLPQIGHEKHVAEILNRVVNDNLSNTFSCKTHKTFNIMVNFTIKFMCHVWAKNLNNLLKGLTCHNKEINSFKDDVMKTAFQYYNTHKKRH